MGIFDFIPICLCFCLFRKKMKVHICNLLEMYLVLENLPSFILRIQQKSMQVKLKKKIVIYNFSALDSLKS